MIKPKEFKTISGIIIAASSYRENNAIVTVLSDNYKYTYRANGAMKPNSKLHLVTYIYSTVQLEVGGFSEHPDIQAVKLLKNRSNIYENLKMMTSLSIVQDIFLNLISEEDRVDTSYLTAFLDFPVGASNANLIFAVFAILLQAMQDIGIFNKSLDCVACGAKIAEPHFYHLHEGGLLCDNCARREFVPPADKMLITILKTAMKIKPEQLYGREPPLGKLLELFDELLVYLDDSVGIKLKSYTNFKNWFLNI